MAKESYQPHNPQQICWTNSWNSQKFPVELIEKMVLDNKRINWVATEEQKEKFQGKRDEDVIKQFSAQFTPHSRNGTVVTYAKYVILYL